MNRLEKLRTLRTQLRGGVPVIGSWMQLSDPNVAEIIGQSGYQFVAVDLEHGAIGVEQLPDLFRALELGGTLPLCRVASPTAINCRQALDQGCAGVIIPMVSSAEQLQSIVAECHWPPRGRRGVGFSRANLFGKSFGDYSSEAQESFIVAQIEHKDAVKHLGSIVEVDGLDAIMVGPYDLSASIGRTGEFESPEFKEVLATILSHCKKSNTPCGIHVVKPDVELLKSRIAEGFTFLVYGVDTVFLSSGAHSPL